MVLSYLSPRIHTSEAVLFSLFKENNFIVQFASLLLAVTNVFNWEMLLAQKVSNLLLNVKSLNFKRF